MNLKPLDDRIVVRPAEPETQTASGLVIPDTAKEKPQQGEVLAVGPGKRSDSTGELIEVGITDLVDAKGLRLVGIKVDSNDGAAPA